MSVRQIIQSFETWRAAASPLVLATVFETLGSTYSKAGHRILIAANGDYRGLVSGGCLEADVREVAISADEVGERLDRLLAARLEDLSRARIQALIRQGHVSGTNGIATNPGAKVKDGDVFRVAVPLPEPATPEGASRRFKGRGMLWTD